MKPRKRFFKKLGISNNNRAVVILETILTMFIVIVAWIFFRAENIGHAINYLSGILSHSLFTFPYFHGRRMAVNIIILVIGFIIIEWFGREKQFAIADLGRRWKRPVRFVIYYAIIIAILLFHGAGQQFIYFQF